MKRTVRRVCVTLAAALGLVATAAAPAAQAGTSFNHTEPLTRAR